MVEMEKYCPKCGRVYKNKESEAKVCMYCAIPLKERKKVEYLFLKESVIKFYKEMVIAVLNVVLARQIDV